MGCVWIQPRGSISCERTERDTHLPQPPFATDLEVLMLGEEVGEVDGLVGAPLRHHHHTPNLLHLGVVRGTHPVQVARYLTKRVERKGGEGRERSQHYTLILNTPGFEGQI